jgi:hypothetical protein
MSTQTIIQDLTYAAPTAAVSVGMADAVYSRLAGVRLLAENDNATAAVQVQIVLSRSSSPLTSGSVATEKALQRGDGFIGTLEMTAGKAAIRSAFDPQSQVLNASELFDATLGAYIGLKAVGLESGKTAKVQVELTFEAVAQSDKSTGVYLAQVVRFQQVGT